MGVSTRSSINYLPILKRYIHKLRKMAWTMRKYFIFHLPNLAKVRVIGERFFWKVDVMYEFPLMICFQICHFFHMNLPNYTDNFQMWHFYAFPFFAFFHIDVRDRIATCKTNVCSFFTVQNKKVPTVKSRAVGCLS